ncbi:MAG: hypothetical protein K6E53_01415 [Lachnospiraceae bacterium]|nr:hypothetical protein [Lachnospiraceae bacterium]
MSTVIYLANQQIQVIEGNRTGKGPASVRRYLTLEAPEGSVINGVVMNEDAFVEFISKAWSEARLPTKDVILVINSTKFVGRTLELPVLNEKSTYEFIGREFAEVGREDADQIFSYIPIGKAETSPELKAPVPDKQVPADKKKGTKKVKQVKAASKAKAVKPVEDKKVTAKARLNRLYVEGVDYDYVNDCVELFTRAGLKLSAIYSDGSNLITLCGATSAKRRRTFVLLVADAMTLTTILWVNGSFNYGNTVRCFFDQGTPEYADDVARTISQLVQFLKSNQSDAVLEGIEIAGINPDDMAMYANAIESQGTEAPVSLYTPTGAASADPELQKYLHTVSGLYGTYKTQDFLQKTIHHKKSGKGSKGINETLRLFIPAFIVFIIMAVVFIAMYIVKSGKNKELDALNEYNERPDVMMDTALFDSLKERTEFLSAQYRAINEIDEDILTFPCGNTDVIQVFRTCAAGYADIEFGAFDAKNGSLSITAKASEVEQINKFIRRLMDEETFEDVDYTGYDYIDNEDKWKINITCTLAESAGRGDAKKLLEESRKRYGIESEEESSEEAVDEPSGETEEEVISWD